MEEEGQRRGGGCVMAFARVDPPVHYKHADCSCRVVPEWNLSLWKMKVLGCLLSDGKEGEEAGEGDSAPDEPGGEEGRG